MLREADRLETLEPDRTLTADASGAVRLDTVLPMPSISQPDPGAGRVAVGGPWCALDGTSYGRGVRKEAAT